MEQRNGLDDGVLVLRLRLLQDEGREGENEDNEDKKDQIRLNIRENVY